MQPAQLHGIFVPMLTPLTADERVDEAPMRRLVDFLIGAGVHGIWAMGTTGEFAALPEAERARGVEATVDQVAHRVPVIANVGDSSTGLALRHARHAVAAGADALALTPPHYYPHSMDEMLIHFRAVKEAFPDLPLLVYNIPQTVKVKMSLATTLQLAREGTVQGIKDSQNDLRWFRLLVQAIRADGLEDQFRLFLGTRILIDAAFVIGAHGAIPATSNVTPAACAEAWEASIRGDFPLAARAQEVVIHYEDLADIARGGSPDAASYSSMKLTLREWGILDDARLTRPLRSFADDEVLELKRRLQGLPHGAQRVAVAV
jgi:4-hydroxy-tetrahydrodipicolinate synthase